MKTKMMSLASKLTTAAMVVSMFAMSMPANAAISLQSDVMSSYVVNTNSSHVITFTTAAAWDAGDTITLDMSAVADITAGWALTDIDVYAGGEKTLVAAGCVADEVTATAVPATDIITLSLCAASTQIPAGQIVIDLGATATTGGAGDSSHVVNVGTAGAHNITVAGTQGDGGTIGVTLTSGAATVMSDKMGRSMISTASSHTILFTRYSPWNAEDTITIDLSEIAVLASFAVTDVDVEAPVASDQTLVDADCDANEIEVTAVGSLITLELCAGSDTIAAGTTMVQLGSVAAGPGVDAHFMNVGSTGSKALDIAGTTGDVGTMYVSLMTNDQIQVTADITSALTFDIDTLHAATCTQAKPDGGYSVGLGTLTPGTAKTADNHICMMLDSNAQDGAVIQVKSLNEGLTSASVSHTIVGTYAAGATTDLSSAVEAYGICVLATTKAAGSEGSDPQQVLPYNGSCVVDAATNEVGGVDNADFQTMVNTNGAPLDGDGYNTVDVLVSAKALSTTPAAIDYTDTLTFRAVGTF
ncbi:MAG: hypothetical protein PHT12_06355 [Patescibacteria group bacterium]|nr:hypothetical protein [Patescibacteria group bacterium]